MCRGSGSPRRCAPGRCATSRWRCSRSLGEGLHRRARRSAAGEDETYFLDPLFAIAGSGRTPAEELLEDYRTRWGGVIDPVFTDYAY